MMTDKIPFAEFRCPHCGVVDISIVENVTVLFAKTNQPPICKVLCERCGQVSIASVDWDSAMLFDRKGCNVVGFSFSRGPLMNESEIDDLIKDNYKNMTLEIEEFFDGTPRR